MTVLEQTVAAARVQASSGALLHPQATPVGDELESGVCQGALGHEGCSEVIQDQCYLGLRSTDEMGSGPVKKPTRFLTNPPLARLICRKRCPGCSSHVSLMNVRAKSELCREICLTLMLQMETASDQLLMERSESLGDDVQEHWGQT